MKGKPKQRKMATRIGPVWWDRNGHISLYTPSDGWVTWGHDEFGRVFRWPRPAQCCTDDAVRLKEAQDLLKLKETYEMTNA